MSVMVSRPEFPSGFLKRSEKMLPEAEFADFIAACQRPLRKSIRINTLKISVSDFLVRAEKKHWKLFPIPWCSAGFWIDRPLAEQKELPLGNTWEHALGLFYIQEASSMLPAEALLYGENLKFKIQHSKFLDMAAAPGSKTTQLAALLQNTGLIVANEFSASRIKKLFANLERSGVKNVALTHLDGSKFAKLTPEAFDAILLDAPCTGEGTIRKDHDALANWSERKIHIAAGVQKQLIVAAFEALKPGGILIYSTCTLAPEENEEICHYLQTKFPESVQFESLAELFPGAKKALTPEGFLRVSPHIFDSEGFFVAKIRKKELKLAFNSAEDRAGFDHQLISHKKLDSRLRGNDRFRNFPFTPIPSTKFAQLEKYYREHFGFIFSFEKNQLWERDRELWLFPENITEFIGTVRFDRIGIKFCEMHDKGIKTLHETAINFGASWAKNSLELTAEDAQKFLAGKDLILNLEKGAIGEFLLRFDGFPIGIGKLQNGRLKNQLPREVAHQSINFSPLPKME